MVRGVRSSYRQIFSKSLIVKELPLSCCQVSSNRPHKGFQVEWCRPARLARVHFLGFLVTLNQDLKETEASPKPTLHFAQLRRVEWPRVRRWSQVTKQVTATAKFIPQGLLILQPSLFPMLLLYKNEAGQGKIKPTVAAQTGDGLPLPPTSLNKGEEGIKTFSAEKR